MFQAAEGAIEEKKERILKEREEEILREQEQLKKTIEIKYNKQLMKMKAEKKKESQLMAAREREMEEEIQKLNEERERQAPQEAESNDGVLSKIAGFIRRVIKKNFNSSGVIIPLFFLLLSLLIFHIFIV